MECEIQNRDFQFNVINSCSYCKKWVEFQYLVVNLKKRKNKNKQTEGTSADECNF